MRKIDRTTSKVLQDLKKGALGKSGERFLTVRELADKYNVSYVSATKILAELVKLPNLIQIGNHVYILNGIADNNCELFKKVRKPNKHIGFFTFSLNNLFTSQIIENVSILARKNGYQVIVMSGSNFEGALKHFVSLGCLGVISFEYETPDKIEALSLLPMPSVIIGNTFKLAFSNYVTTNNFIAAETVAKHLFECNYSSYCYIGPNPEKESRFSGYRKKLLELGVAKENVLSFKNSNDMLPTELINMIKNASESNRLGIFCFHDVIALTLYNEIKKYKKSIPQEIGVVGFDNLSISDILTPRLTSVYYNFNELANFAFTAILNSINNPNSPTVKKVTVPSLIIKDSSKKLN